MNLWVLRHLQKHLTSIAYAEVLLEARRKGKIGWLKPSWFFDDEIKTSRKELLTAIRRAKAEMGGAR